MVITERVIASICLFCSIIYGSSLVPSDPSEVLDVTPRHRTHGLGIDIERATGAYRLYVNGVAWLDSAPTFFTVNGKRYSTAKGGGLRISGWASEEGSDQLGPWNATVVTFTPLDVAGIELQIAFKQYRYFPDVVLFGQIFPTDVEATSVGNRNGVCTGFPRFNVPKAQRNERMRYQNTAETFKTAGKRLRRNAKRVETVPMDRNDAETNRNMVRMHRNATGRNRHVPKQPDLGYLAYGGIMFGDTAKAIGRWNSNEVKRIASGLDSGPLVLFSASGDALVVSPFSQFMALSAVYGEAEGEQGQMSATWGLMGNTKRVPRYFASWVIASYSGEGINMAMTRWGELMRVYYGRGTEYRDSDLTNNYIGFWTDNGAYYYYKTEPGLNYENTLLSEVRYASDNSIPYRYIQYDSWFYYKGSQNGVKEWISMPSIFPNGMQYVWNKTGLTVVAHNRWWSYQTVYAKQNGGKYNFVVEQESKKALPTDQEFWDDLLRESRKWGLIVYEQDWLNEQFDEMDATVSDLTLGRQWLLQMGKGAAKNGLTIQYCMAPSRHALQSLEIPVVSQGRVSTDYQPGNDQWKIGISSMFAHALGVAPFKDNFWTTTNQPGNPYNRTEPYPQLESVVSTLSTGPVAPSDRIGYSDKKLIMRSCNDDGLILKPSKPATSIDLQIIQAAFKGFTCEVWSTFSFISGWFFGIILAADCRPGESISISPAEAGFGPKFPESVAFSWFQPEAGFPFNGSSSLTLSGCLKNPFCLYLTAPVIRTASGKRIVLYGELSKWVSMSPNRVREINRSQAEVYVALQGASSEHVTFTYSVDGVMVNLECVLSAEGMATLHVVAERCWT